MLTGMIRETAVRKEKRRTASGTFSKFTDPAAKIVADENAIAERQLFSVYNEIRN